MANELYGSIIHNGVNYSLGDGANSANKTDLTAIILTGTTNTSGDVISAGTWFYLNGTPCIAKVDIASGATFTEGTNYEEKTIGNALSELNSKIGGSEFNVLSTSSGSNIDNMTTTSGWCWINGESGTYPGGVSYIPGWFIVFTVPDLKGSYCVQFLARYTGDYLYMRTKVNGTLGDWFTIK